MSLTFPNSSFNDLESFEIIGGADQELIFNIYSSGCAILNINPGNVTWYLAPYGSSTAVVTKTGIYSGSPVNQFIVKLTGADSASLSGKYVQSYQIIDSSGSILKPSQGTILVHPALS